MLKLNLYFQTKKNYFLDFNWVSIEKNYYKLET